MNEDMSEIINKLSSIMNNNSDSNKPDTSNENQSSGNTSISPEMISGMLEMLNSKGDSDKANDNGSNNSENSMPNIDINTILKLKSVFDKMNSKDDPRSKLLLALKPYLKESRKEKVEQYIQFFNMSKIIEAFGANNGGDVHK